MQLSHGTANKILVRIAHAQMPQINAYAEIHAYSKAKVLNFILSFYLH